MAFAFDNKYGPSDVLSLSHQTWNMCNFNSWISNNPNDTKFLKKESASDTFQVLTKIRSSEIPGYIQKLQGQNVFLKVAPNKTIREHSVVRGVPVANPLLCEIIAYRYFTYLRQACTLTAVVPYRGDFSCYFKSPSKDNLSTFLGIDLGTGSKISFIDKALSVSSDPEEHAWTGEKAAHILITDAFPENFKTMSDRLESPIFRNELKGLEGQSIAYQLEYVTNQFYRSGIRHNDLHDKNVWVEKLSKPVTLYFYEKIEGVVAEISFTTSYRIWVIDFDRVGLVTARVKNELTASGLGGRNMCTYIGECDYPSEVFDMNIILMRINLTTRRIPDLSGYPEDSIFREGDFARYMRVKYPNIVDANYQPYIDGTFARGFIAHLCRQRRNCDKPHDNFSWGVDTRILSHSELLSSVDIFRRAFPGLNVRKVESKQEIETRVNSNPFGNVSISLSIRNPFREDLKVVLDSLYEAIRLNTADIREHLQKDEKPVKPAPKFVARPFKPPKPERVVYSDPMDVS